MVAKDQTCRVPGRYIGENVAFLRDVIEYATSSNVLVAILSLDQEKAFDRVDWTLMHATLRKMGFRPSFVKWVNLLYMNVQSSVNVDGYLSPFFCCPVGLDRVVPCLLFCTSLSLKFWLLISIPTHVSLVFPFQGPLLFVSYFTVRR